jgi:hypothetical protein
MTREFQHVAPAEPAPEREVLYTWDALIEHSVLEAEVIG